MKNKIVFVYPNRSTFILQDIEILTSSYDVVENSYNWKKKFLVPFYMISQLFFFMFKGKGVKHILISFGGYWAFVPTLYAKLTGKKVSIILHGTDSCNFKEINYGSIGRPFLNGLLKYSYKHATNLLPVSESLIHTKNTYFKKGLDINQGVKHFFPQVKTNYKVVFNGLDCSKWNLSTIINRDSHQFVTVLSAGQFVRKGGPLIVEAAKLMPEFKFVFAGVETPKEIDLPDNVTFLGRLTSTELEELYNSSKYYLQLSVYEGFGYSLLESMACGCVPIVSNVNMMPEIVGNDDLVLHERDADALKSMVQELEKSKFDLNDFRTRVIENYSIERRHSELLEIMG